MMSITSARGLYGKVPLASAGHLEMMSASSGGIRCGGAGCGKFRISLHRVPVLHALLTELASDCQTIASYPLAFLPCLFPVVTYHLPVPSPGMCLTPPWTPLFIPWPYGIQWGPCRSAIALRRSEAVYLPCIFLLCGLATGEY